MALSQGEERGIEGLLIDPVDEPSIIPEMGHRCYSKFRSNPLQAW
jgi:hypothetical protein